MYWSFNNALWFSIVTSTFTGYGDFYPIPYEAKIFNIFMILGFLYIHAQLLGQNFEIYHQWESTRSQSLYNTKMKGLLMGVLVGYIIVMGGIFYGIEKGEGAFSSDHEDSTYLDAIYFMVVTLSSVGYGDIVPELNGGYFIGMLTCWLSVALYQFVLIVAISDRIIANKDRQADLISDAVGGDEVPISLDRRDAPSYKDIPPSYNDATNDGYNSGTKPTAPSNNLNAKLL